MKKPFQHVVAALLITQLIACGDGRMSPQGGTITSVQGGNGLTGGATGGVATLAVGCGTGLTCAADSISVSSSVLTGTISNDTVPVGSAGALVNSSITAYSTGNVFIGSTPTDTGIKLKVNGAGYFTGVLDVAGNVNVNNNKFNVTASNGNTEVAGTLIVASTTSLSGGFYLGANSDAQSHKIINLTNGSSAQDAAAFGQIAAAVGSAVAGTGNRVAKFTATNVVGDTAFPIDDAANALTLGNSTALDVTTISGRVSLTNTDSTNNALNITMTPSAGTTSEASGLYLTYGGTIDTTAGIVVVNGFSMDMTTSRSAGSNNLIVQGARSIITSTAQNVRAGRFGVNAGPTVASYGVYASTAAAATDNFGVFSQVTATGTTNYGVDSAVTGAGTTNYGIRTSATGASNNYALNTVAGTNYLNSGSGNTCVGVSVGGTCAAKLTVTGDATISTTLGVTGLITATAGLTTPVNVTTTGTGDVVSGDALTVANNATLGDNPASDVHQLNGRTTVTSTGSTLWALAATMTPSAGTTSFIATTQFNMAGTMDTTAGSLSVYAANYSATTTRSAGANDLGVTGMFAAASGGQNITGVRGLVSGGTSTVATGVSASSTATTGTTYGVDASATGAATTNYGIRATATGASNNYALNTIAGNNYLNSTSGNTYVGAAVASGFSARLQVVNTVSTVSALQSTHTPTAGTTDQLYAVGASSAGTMDTTAGALTVHGGLFGVSTTRSAGANELFVNGFTASASGGTTVRGARISGSGSAATVFGALITSTATGTTSYGISTQATGAATTNFGLVTTATGAGTNIALQTDAGTNYLNASNGNTCIGIASAGTCAAKLTLTGNATISTTLAVGGNATLGDGTADTTYQWGHLTLDGTAPTLSSCGSSPTVIGTDRKGLITVGATGTACTATFSRTYTSTNVTCRVSARVGANQASLTYTTSATALTMSAAVPGDYDYDCGCVGSSCT